ncbi:transposable element Tc3 transposase [Trichonephila clavipes]|uniref:Transposable element Tc3 transposase n=1 Tax=Trichonephila clavipes TaxID=2585209 RepID=A0A8X6VR88_TRICX|nr:transposable element Tc3 transposase [Trichonephila clavipes]
MPDIQHDVDSELGTALVSKQLCELPHAACSSLRSSACGNVSFKLATFIARAELERRERLDLRFRGIILSSRLHSARNTCACRNAPCHVGVLIDDFLETENIQRMSWPANSPDLNPIEHLCDVLGRQIAAFSHPPSSITELKRALQKA